MKSRKRLLIVLAVLICLTALGFYGNPFPAKAMPAYVHCSVDHDPHTELTDEAANAVTAAFQNLRLSWFPEPKTMNLYFPQPEKQYIHLILGEAAFVHLSIRETDTVYAYAQPWGGRTYKVLNPEALAPLVPLLNQHAASPTTL